MFQCEDRYLGYRFAVLLLKVAHVSCMFFLKFLQCVFLLLSHLLYVPLHGHIPEAQKRDTHQETKVQYWPKEE